jgi:gluconolactonase
MIPGAARAARLRSATPEGHTLQQSFIARLGGTALTALALATAVARADVTEVTPAAYPEGPAWIGGKLYYVEYAGSGVKLWDGRTPRKVWSKEHCGASGLIGFGHEHLLVACYDSNSLVEIDLSGHEIRTIDRDDAGHAFTGPNDFTADGKGGVYLTASGVYDLKAPITGTVLHLSADGRHLVELANTIHYSNGLTLTADGKTLLVAEMLAARILAFPVNADGSLGPRRVWARLQDLAPPTPNADAYNGPDGLKLGPDGLYYIAQNGSGRVLVVDEAPHLIRLIEVRTPFVTNMAFGPDGAVFVTGLFDQWNPPYPGFVFRWTR